MTVSVRFHSSYRQFTGCEQTIALLPEGTSLGALHGFLLKRFPKLNGVRESTHFLVGSKARDGDHVLSEGDEACFAPAGALEN